MLSLAIGITIRLQSIQVDHKLIFGDEQVVAEVIEQFQFQCVDVYFCDSAYLGVVLVLIEEIICEFGSDHNSGYQQPA